MARRMKNSISRPRICRRAPMNPSCRTSQYISFSGNTTAMDQPVRSMGE